MKKIIGIALLGLFSNSIMAQELNLENTFWKVKNIESNGDIVLEKISAADAKTKIAQYQNGVISYNSNNKFELYNKCSSQFGKITFSDDYKQVYFSTSLAEKSDDCIAPKTLTGKFNISKDEKTIALKFISDDEFPNLDNNDGEEIMEISTIQEEKPTKAKVPKKINSKK